MSGADGEGRVASKESLEPRLPKRFYNDVCVVSRATGPLAHKGGKTAPSGPPGYGVLLDGRGIRTPGKRALVLPTKALALAIAAEWAAQGDVIDPESMPLTKLANTAVDAVAGHERAVAADIVAYAGRDLLCYRAAGPRDLIDLEARGWDPLLNWCHVTLGAPCVAAEGVVPIDQSPAARQAFDHALAGFGAFELAGLHVMTTLTGSAILALAVAKGRLSAKEAWALAHIDEEWQESRWGKDALAMARRERRWVEMAAASQFVVLGPLGKDGAHD